MFVVRRYPLRTVRYIEVLMRVLYETNPFLEKCPLEGGVRYREVSLHWLLRDSLRHRITAYVNYSSI